MLNLNFIPRFDMISSDAGSIKTLAAQSSPNLHIGYPPSPSNMSSDYSGNEFATPDPRIWSPLVPDEHDIHSFHPSMTRDSGEVKPTEPISTVYHNIQLKEDRPEHGSREERRSADICFQQSTPNLARLLEDLLEENDRLKGMILKLTDGMPKEGQSIDNRMDYSS